LILSIPNLVTKFQGPLLPFNYKLIPNFLRNHVYQISLLSASTRRSGVAKQRNNLAKADLSCRVNLLERKKGESSPFSS